MTSEAGTAPALVEITRPWRSCLTSAVCPITIAMQGTFYEQFYSWHQVASEPWREWWWGHLPKGRLVELLAEHGSFSWSLYLEGALPRRFCTSLSKEHMGKCHHQEWNSGCPEALQHLFRLLYAFLLNQTCSSYWVILPCVMDWSSSHPQGRASC